MECRYQLPNRASQRTSGTRGGAHLPPNVRPHVATVSDEERQHRPPDHAGHAFALEAQQDLQTILRAYLDSLHLTFQSLAVLVECLGSPDEVALSFGRHCLRETLDSCDEGSTARLEVVDARDARQIQFVATAHPLAEHDIGTVPVDLSAASEPVRRALEVVAAHL